MEFEALGKKVRKPQRKLETFPRPDNVTVVKMTSDEVTSICPVTGQPDFEKVEIEYAPDKFCIESKSLKLYFWQFRQEGHFCEALADKIAKDFYAACNPHWCKVTVIQKPRGGIEIFSTAQIGKG